MVQPGRSSKFSYWISIAETDFGTNNGKPAG